MVEFAIHGFQQRTFARAYFADNVHKIAFIDLQIDIFKHDVVVLHDIYFLVVYQHI